MKLSKNLRLSKSAGIFLLFLLLLACQEKETQQKPIDISATEIFQSGEEKLQVYRPLRLGVLSNPVEYVFTDPEMDLASKVSAVLTFMERALETDAVVDDKMLGCQHRFTHQQRVYLECNGLQSGSMGLATEKLVLLALLKTLFGLDEIKSISFIVNRQYADVFVSDLVLPKIVDRDFMNRLEKQVETIKKAS
ncbi:MAG: hypothetical protein KDK51_03135 [Deltaproteobacteria bacterium]|nr:hypothetical protein [Deltaproteobacteria bacterium]